MQCSVKFFVLLKNKLLTFFVCYCYSLHVDTSPPISELEACCSVATQNGFRGGFGECFK